MATLEKIRNRAGVLVAVVIGMALLAFILGDFLNSGGALFSNSQFEIAEIAGKSIPYQKYQSMLNEAMGIEKNRSGQATLDDQTVTRIQDQVWQQILNEYILEEGYKELGIDVSSGELWDMVQGENLHPTLKRAFTDPETGLVNNIAIIRYLKNVENDPNAKANWIQFEKQLIQDQKSIKYFTLIRKGLYSTKAEAQNELDLLNKKVDFDFISQNLNTIADSLINITNSDLKEYYNNHQINYKQGASRNIEYITFDVVASEIDKKDTEEWINNTKQEFANTDSDKDFVGLNSDLAFDNSFYKQDELPEQLQDVIFNEKEGFIYGPYFDNGIYLLAKLSEVKDMPDSVKARHILLQPTQNEDYNQLMATADSLKSLLENGADFASISNKYSTDKVAKEKGGDLGWFRANEKVSPFSDTCFIAKTREYKIVATQYGLHIVQVTNKARFERKVKIALLGRKLEPSTETYQNTYAEASKFAGNNHTYEEFIAAIETENLTKKVANNIHEGDQQLAGLESPRELIRSIYNTDNMNLIKSQNNPIFELNNRFVIGFVTEIKEEGIAPFEQVKQQLMVLVKKEKKAEMIAAKLQEALNENNDLNFLANKFNTKIQEATDITFRSYSVPYAGIEPKLVAVATSLNADQISSPIKGNNGVFVIKVKSVSIEENTNVQFQKMQTETQYQRRANIEAFEALKGTANIIDKRAKFY